MSWREKITPPLEALELDVLDPCKKHIEGSGDLSEIGKSKEKFKQLVMTERWDEVKKQFWPIVRTDLRMVDHCDFVILKYDPTVPTVGTIHELVVATFEKKVILLKYDRSQLDKFNSWMATFIKSHHFFAEWNDMYTYLERVNQGELDTSYWVL